MAFKCCKGYAKDDARLLLSKAKILKKKKHYLYECKFSGEGTAVAIELEQIILLCKGGKANTFYLSTYTFKSEFFFGKARIALVSRLINCLFSFKLMKEAYKKEEHCPYTIFDHKLEIRLLLYCHLLHTRLRVSLPCISALAFKFLVNIIQKKDLITEGGLLFFSSAMHVIVSLYIFTLIKR